MQYYEVVDEGLGEAVGIVGIDASEEKAQDLALEFQKVKDKRMGSTENALANEFAEFLEEKGIKAQRFYAETQLMI